MSRSNQALIRVREFIEKQAVVRDGRIPPERTLASELGVVRPARDMLEQEGRIHRHQGRGTFIDTRSPVRAVAVLSAPEGSARGVRVGENGHCYKRQSVHAGLNELIAAATQHATGRKHSTSTSWLCPARGGPIAQLVWVTCRVLLRK